MSIRLPLQTIHDFDDVGQVGAGSVAGGVARTFLLPQDVDGVVVKLTASIIGGGVSATFQTSDDGGTTYYDVARTSIVSNANNAVTAQWLNIPVSGVGVRTGVVAPSVVATGSVQSFGSVYSATGSSGASTLGQLEVSGLPVLGVANRVFLRYTAAVSGNDLARIRVMVNSRSNTT